MNVLLNSMLLIPSWIVSILWGILSGLIACVGTVLLYKKMKWPLGGEKKDSNTDHKA